MKCRDSGPISAAETICSKCGQPFELSIVIENGKPEAYLQCWRCFTSMKLHRLERQERTIPRLGYRLIKPQTTNQKSGIRP